jgi:hypothetical protein
MYACAPPPPRRIARLPPRTRVKTLGPGLLRKIYCTFFGSARDGRFCGDCSLGGGG